MQYEEDLIAPALLNDFDGKEERVEELFLDDDDVGLLEGLMKLKTKEELTSPEDLAWVDSCLLADPELPMKSWDSLKEALLDTITTFANFYEENNASGLDEDEAGNGEHMEVDEKECVGQPEIVNDQEYAPHIRSQADRIRGDNCDDDGEEEFQKEIESRENIFRVWDLLQEQEEEEVELIPELKRAVADPLVVEEEEDQFITELKRSVAESILRDKQMLNTDDASTAEDGKLDELISSMGDLSLKSSSI